MSQKFLPNGWKTGRLGDRTLARTLSGGTPNRSVPEYFGGGIPWVKSGELNDNYILDTEEKITELGLEKSSAKIFPKGTLLIAMYGATAGKTGILALDATTNQAVCAIFPMSDSFDSNFLQYYLINIRDEILCSRSGGAQPNISQRVIGSLNVVLPPLPEQRAIARALRAVQGAREARLREVALERERKAALMEHLFTHGTRGEATKMTEIGEMPESWRLVKFGEIAKFKNGLNFSRGQKGSGMLTLDVLNMYTENIYLNISNLYRVNKEIKNDYLLKPNDIILVRSSLKQDGVGWPSLFYGYTEPVTFCGFLIRSRLATKDIDPGFLVNYLRLPRVRRHMISKSEKVAITNINQGNTSAIPIPIPSIDEQKEIETTLHACDSKIAALDNEASLHQELFRAMLEELMSGALRADSLVDAASKGCQN